jgi:hypothetical protein
MEKMAKECSGDSSQYSRDPGRGGSGDVANQYLHPDGRGYQEFTQYRRVRGRVDLDSADVRDNRRDTRSQDAGIEVIKPYGQRTIILPATERRSPRGDG